MENNLVPMVIQQTANGERAMDIFSRLLEDRVIYMIGGVTDISSSVICSSLLHLDSLNHKDIDIYVDSPGGSVFSGMSIIDTMGFLDSKVNVIATGMAASMGSVILAGATGKRRILPNAEVMLHQVISGSQGQSIDVTRSANHTHNLNQRMIRFFMQQTGQSREEIKRVMDRDYWFDAKEALEFGLVDEIVEMKHSPRHEVPESVMHMKNKNEDWD